MAIYKREMEYYMNRNGKFYFRTLDRLAKLIVTADVKSIPGFNIQYGDMLIMNFETK